MLFVYYLLIIIKHILKMLIKMWRIYIYLCGEFTNTVKSPWLWQITSIPLKTIEGIESVSEAL